MVEEGKSGRGVRISRRAAAGALAGVAMGMPQLANGAQTMMAQSAPGDRRRLTFGLTRNLHTAPIIERRVQSSALDPAITTVYGTELFARQLRDAEFDAAEMSISSLLMAISRGERRFVGVPVFTTRRFYHTGILVRRDAGINTPSDLRGKRVGVPEYHQTAILWTRGVLQDEFGVGLQDMEIWMERAPGGSLASAMGFRVPSSVRQIPPEKSIGSMMLSGEIDAALAYIRTSDPQPLGDRSTADLANSALVRPLFPDPRSEAVRFFNKTGLHPVNHCMVLRRSLAEQYPSLSAAIVSLFDDAAALVSADRLEHISYHYDAGRIDQASYDALKAPVVLHGIDENRCLLETMCRYSDEQGLSARRMTLAQVFPGVGA